jgi:hypothetical protein
MTTREFGGRIAASLVACLVLAACGHDASGPSATAKDEEVAATLEDIAQQQAQRGASETSREIGWAALALRSGIAPSHYTMLRAGQTEVFDAFVQAVAFPVVSELLPIAPRTMVAWRHDGPTTRVLVITTLMDDSQVINPLSPGPLSPLDGAAVTFIESDSAGARIWLGINGRAQTEQRALGDECLAPSADGSQLPKGVECRAADFVVGFEMALQRALQNGFDVDPGSPVLHLTGGNQIVNGARLTFECLNPQVPAGCP